MYAQDFDAVTPTQPCGCQYAYLPEAPRRSSLRKHRMFQHSPAPIDLQFGLAGKVSLRRGYSHFPFGCVQIIPSRHVAGTYYTAYASRHWDCATGAICRLKADGSLDTSFNQTGTVELDGRFATPNNLIEGEDGSVIALCYVYDPTVFNNYRLQLVKLTPSGQVDDSFGNRGWVDLWDLMEHATPPRRLGLTLHDGKYLVNVMGDLPYSGGGYYADTLLIMITQSGQADTGFAQGGVKKLAFHFSQNWNEQFNVSCVASIRDDAMNSRIVVAGQRDVPGNLLSTLLCLDSQGEVVMSFGDDGVCVIPPVPSVPYPYVFHLSADDDSKRITATGEGPFICRITYAGEMAQEFNGGQLVIHPEIPGAIWCGTTQVRNNGVVGTGLFEGRPYAFAYTRTGELNTSFCPPEGIGQLSELSAMSEAQPAPVYDELSNRLIFPGWMNDKQQELHAGLVAIKG
jgi:hypothetical protein